MTSTQQQLQEQVVLGVTTKLTAGGAVTSVVSGLTLNDWGVIIGIGIGVIGLVSNLGLNYWFKHQHLKILKEELDIKKEED